MMVVIQRIRINIIQFNSDILYNYHTSLIIHLFLFHIINFLPE